MDGSGEDLVSLLSLEKERRFAAEALAEAEKQALLQLLLYLKEKLEPTSPLSLGEDQQDFIRRVSSSASIGNLSSAALPRAFSREFYDAVLQEMPGELKESLATVQQEDKSTSGQ